MSDVSREDTQLLVSVIIPCRNEARYIEQCLNSILSQDFPVDQMEIIIADGMSDDETPQIIDRLAASAPVCIQRIENPGKIVPTGLNRAICSARGEIIIRLDAHSIYPADYISLCVHHLQESGADNVGGIWVTHPGGTSRMARSIAIAAAHVFGVGNAHYRVGTHEIREVDTVPFGCYRRDVFQQVGGFDEELVRNQDDELNHRIRVHGGRILLVPEIHSIYHARETFLRLAMQHYQYGLYKPLAARKLGHIPTIRQLVPAGFVAFLGLAVLAGPFCPYLRRLCRRIIMLYTLLSGFFAFRSATRENDLMLTPWIMVGFFVLHFSYGLGYLQGLRRAIPAPAGPPDLFPDV